MPTTQRTPGSCMTHLPAPRAPGVQDPGRSPAVPSSLGARRPGGRTAQQFGHRPFGYGRQVRSAFLVGRHRRRGAADRHLSHRKALNIVLTIYEAAGVWVRPSGAKGRSAWQWQTVLVFLSPCAPPRLRLTNARSLPPPSTLASSTSCPERLIGDRAYDADPLDAALATLGIEMIAPHRRGRVRPKTQDGRPLRRYKRRY
jgi:hypothetical protein